MSGLRAFAALTVLVAAAAAAEGQYGKTTPGDARIELAGGLYAPAALERGQNVKGVLRLPGPVAARGARITVRISDSLGRLLVERGVPAPAVEETFTEAPLDVPLPNAIAQRHFINVVVARPGAAPLAAGTDFIVMPPRQWDDYVCTIWHRHNAKRIPHLQRMFLSGSQWTGSSSHLPAHFINANYRYYLETGATWVYSAYHMWMPDKPKTFYHKQTKAAFMKDRTNFRLLERDPCMSNEHVRRRIEWIFTHQARLHRATRPLFYTVADEPGIANQAAPFDYCHGPYCRQAFRAWLKKRYKTLDALNKQWGGDRKSWEDVRGATTDEIFARKGENFSPWCDHKEFMDDVLVGAYALAKKAMRRHDPAGRIGMGGAQGPAAVGGWDFWKLCQAFDVLEAYYIGNNYELMRSFNPRLIPVHASFGPGDPEKHLIWYLFIHGDRGLLVWDDKSKYVDDKGNYSARAKEAKGWYRELTGGIGKLRIASKRADDPIALYHSQANLRVHWVLEVRPSGRNWIRRDSWSERINSRYFRLRESWVKLIEDNGLQFKFLCPAQVGRGELKVYDRKTGRGFKVLVLPEIWALSDAEVDAIRKFVAAGGTIIADRLGGTFDARGRKRKASPLTKLFRQARAVLLDRDMLAYYQQRVYPGDKEAALKRLVGDLLRKAVGADRVTPVVVGRDGKPVTGVEVTVWRNGSAELIALHRNPLLRINELGPQEYKSNKKFEVPVTLTVRSATQARWYDVRAAKRLRAVQDVTVTLPPFEPVFLTKLPPPTPQAMAGAARPPWARVSGGKLLIQPAGAAAPVYHLDFVGPDGKERLAYRTNVTAQRPGTSFPLPLALNDTPGRWTLKVREVATGAKRDVDFTHKP